LILTYSTFLTRSGFPERVFFEKQKAVRQLADGFGKYDKKPLAAFHDITS
jgi:hypothetical protein